MKNPTSLVVAFLLATMVIGSIPHVSSLTVDLTVFTSNASYIVTDDMTIYGNLTYDGSHVPNWPVAIEVQDPLGTVVLTRTPQTNSSGAYTLTFKLPIDAKRGTYTVYASASYKGEIATNNTTFELLAHDITLSSVTAAPIIICQTYGCEVAVSAANRGDFAETFNLTVYANMTDTGNFTAIHTFENVTLLSHDSTMLLFTWGTTGFGLGNYKISAHATQVIGEINVADNTCMGNSIQIIAGMTGGGGGRIPYMD